MYFYCTVCGQKLDWGVRMIDKFNGIYTLTCDICGEDAPETFDDFYDAVQYKRTTAGKARNGTGNGKMYVQSVGAMRKKVRTKKIRFKKKSNAFMTVYVFLDCYSKDIDKLSYMYKTKESEVAMETVARFPADGSAGGDKRAMAG